jgi:hypothetical protein
MSYIDERCIERADEERPNPWEDQADDDDEIEDLDLNDDEEEDSR